MRKFTVLCLKFVSILFNIFIAAYRIVVSLLSYAFIGLSLLCVFGAGAEFFTIGFTEEAFYFILLGVASMVVRFLLILSVSGLEVLEDALETRIAIMNDDFFYDLFDQDRYEIEAYN